jgi:hypothetical protein
MADRIPVKAGAKKGSLEKKLLLKNFGWENSKITGKMV